MSRLIYQIWPRFSAHAAESLEGAQSAALTLLPDEAALTDKRDLDVRLSSVGGWAHPSN
jgi:hypothetical protein